jgi:DNA-binding NtrC family response regulator
MEIAPGLFLNSGRLDLLRDPAVLFVESNPDLLEALPLTLKRALPHVTIDGCASAERGLRMVYSGRYHAVVSDARSAEADDYSLLKGAGALSCPIPLLLSSTVSDAEALKRTLKRGAFDVIRNPSRAVEASETISRALWFYQLRLTICQRRQRLDEYLRKKRLYDSAEQEGGSRRISEQRSRIVEKAVQDMEQTNILCERTIHQIDTSLRMLEQMSREFELHTRDCAERIVRLLEP